VTSFEAIAERSAFDTPRHRSLPSADAFEFLRVGFFFFIVTLVLRFLKWALLVITLPNPFQFAIHKLRALTYMFDSP
jgi:hypothetical protein